MRPESGHFDWASYAVPFGRLIGAATILIGGALAIWNGVDIGGLPDDVYGRHYTIRITIPEVLTYVWYGALVLIVAEMLAVTNGNALHAGAIDWQIPQLTRILAVVIFAGGTTVTVWDIYAMHDVYESGLDFVKVFSSGPGRSASDDTRYFLGAELQTYLWQGGLLVLLAALAERMGWRHEELPEEEEGSSVATEP